MSPVNYRHFFFSWPQTVSKRRELVTFNKAVSVLGTLLKLNLNVFSSFNIPILSEIWDYIE